MTLPPAKPIENPTGIAKPQADSALPPFTPITGGREIAAASRNAALTEKYRLATEAQKSSDFATAERLYREILADAPHHAGALANLGSVLRAIGRTEEAYERLEAAIARLPGNDGMVCRLASWCLADGAAERGLSVLRAALALTPSSPELHHALIADLRRLGRTKDLIEACQGATQAAPQIADFHLWLGEALAATGGSEKAAEAAFRAATERNPKLFLAWVGLGALLARTGRGEQGIALLRHAETIRPSYQAQLYLSGALLQRNRFGEAEAVSREALALTPDSRPARRHLVEALYARSLTDQAVAAVQPLLTGPERAESRFMDALLMPVILPHRAAIDQWRTRISARLDAIRHDPLPVARPEAAMAFTNFRLAYHARDDKSLQMKTTATLLESAPSLAWTAPKPAPSPKIRIGLVSHFFGLHTIAVLNRGLLEELDRERFHVTVCMLPGAENPLRELYRKRADRIVDLPLDLARSRQLIAAAELDLLYYCDIGMSPFTYLLAFARLAPVQCVTWGHPDTTGIPNLDYFVSCDAMEPPGAEAHYSERLIRLPGPTVSVERVELPAIKPRAAFGLPEDAHLYVCPQSLFKLHPDFDAVVASILSADPRGHLVLLEGKDPHHKEILLDRLRSDANPDSARIRVLPQQSPADFVNLIAVSDVMLDPLHYSGGKTTLEAFAMAVPVVTWPGEFMRGRHTHGFYRLMGMNRLSAADLDEYVRLAVTLGTDPDARQAASAEIRSKREVLYRDIGSIRALETFFTEAVAAARRGGTVA